MARSLLRAQVLRISVECIAQFRRGDSHVTLSICKGWRRETERAVRWIVDEGLRPRRVGFAPARPPSTASTNHSQSPEGRRGALTLLFCLAAAEAREQFYLLLTVWEGSFSGFSKISEDILRQDFRDLNTGRQLSCFRSSFVHGDNGVYMILRLWEKLRTLTW